MNGAIYVQAFCHVVWRDLIKPRLDAMGYTVLSEREQDLCRAMVEAVGTKWATEPHLRERLDAAVEIDLEQLRSEMANRSPAGG